MMRRGVLMLGVFCALALLALPAFGQMEMVEPNVYIHDAWARSTASVEAAQADATPEAGAMDMGAVSAVYLALANAGGVGLRLVSAESPVAEFVEIHEMVMDGDIMRMRPVENGLDLLSGSVVSLEPGGYHLMLINLVEPLVAGQAVPLALTFIVLDDAGQPTEETVTYQVAAPVLDEAPEPTPFAFSLVWARPAEAGGVTGAYLHMLNIADADDTLVSASSSVSDVVEIHEMRMVNEVMEMRPVEGGVPVASGDIAVLEPGGLHIMLMDLNQALDDGSAFSLTLTFESGQEVTIGVPVYDRTMMEMSGM